MSKNIDNINTFLPNEEESMLFACDIGNTSITIGVFAGKKLLFTGKLSSVVARSADEYAILLNGIFAMHNFVPEEIKGSIISSVVRPLNNTIKKAIEKIMKVKPLMIGPGVKNGLNIKTEIPSQLGADIVADSVAALSLARPPLVILAIGTATTLTGINEKGELSGVIICPGISTSLDALSSNAAELPPIALEAPGKLLGRNTVDSMTSGIIYGHAAMIEGLLDQIAAKWETESLQVIATGSLADRVLPYMKDRHKIDYKNDLTLIGLCKIYSLNKKRR